jgi:CheY-like chemotaxis protein
MLRLFPDLILLDMHMPVMDGYEVMTEISKDAKPLARRKADHVLREAADIQKCTACAAITSPVFDFTTLIKQSAIGGLLADRCSGV